VAEPKLRVRSSGHGGSGYVLPARQGDEFKEVKNTSGETIKARLVDGKTVIVPGVTTVLNKLEKPAVTQWAVDNTAAFAVANLDNLYRMSEEAGWGFLRWYWTRDPIKGDFTDIRNYSSGVLADSAGLGTMIHEWIEAEHAAGEFPDTSFAPEHFWQVLEQWQMLNMRRKITPIMSEATVWSDKGYAGTLDGLWEIDGVETLVDLKTSRNVYDSHWMQVASLRHADVLLVEAQDGFWEERDWSDKHSLPLALVRLRPSDVDKDGLEVAPYSDIVYCDEEEVPLHLNAFLGLLETSKNQRQLVELRKNKKAQLKNNAGFPV
jgi:hypothetical protein